MPRRTSEHKAAAFLRVPVARYHRAAMTPGRITTRHHRSG